MKCLFLYNPNSGRGKIAGNIGKIRKKLHTRYEKVVIYAANGAQDLENKIRESVGKYDAIIFSGGDGTFNNVLQGVGEADVQLGYIPSGTVNDVARSLKIPRSINGALKVILKGHSRRLDCMRVNGERYAMYIAAAGAFTEATYRTPQKQKRALGALAYAFEGIRNNLNFEVFPLRVECGGKVLETHAVLILAMNGKSVAGFPINRDSSMTDGKIEVAVIHQAERPGILRRIGAFFSVASLIVFGCRIHKKDITYLKGPKLVVKTSESLVWDFDGEEGIRGDVEIEVCPRRVKLFVPKK